MMEAIILEERGEQKRFRLEIEGLRALAAILVAVYHIWFNRVSGGVDVFFVVSGFLITTSLLSRYAKRAKVGYFSYIVKLIKRLLPTAWFISFVVLIASLNILPLIMRQQLLKEFTASVFYFENWRLIIDATDYLAKNNTASPFQHFWALSIQFQFYLLWLALFFIVIRLLNLPRVVGAIPMRTLLFWHMLLLVVCSFCYSMYLTDMHQQVAYYHTFTRLWEFGLGGLLAITINKIPVHKIAAWFLGWAGVIGLISCGIILQVSTVFPGYMALWPTLSAVCIIIAGNRAQKFSAYQLLSLPPLVQFGKISYAFYLWHWPLLILYYAYTNAEQVSLVAGLSIIALAVLLSVVTTIIIEKPIRKTTASLKVNGAVIAGLVLLMFGAITVWQSIVQAQMRYELTDEQIEHIWSGENYTDAFNKALLPSEEIAKNDHSMIYQDGCMQINGSTEIKKCSYGEQQQPAYTIALVGGSHSAHWQPMLDEIAKNHAIKVDTYLKSDCRFTLDDDRGLTECDTWLKKVMATLAQDKPDLLFTVGDTAQNKAVTIPHGFKEAWQLAEDHNIDLFLVRDGPWYRFNVVDCVMENTDDISRCAIPRDEVIVKDSPMSKEKYIPQNVFYKDMTNYFCDDDYCYPVIGNVITHFDTNHISATFSRSLAKAFEDDIMQILTQKTEK